MNQYLKWNEQTISDFSDKNINRLYNDGYLFGRVEKGYMYQTRSLRIDLNKFQLSSENRRILRKTNDLKITNYQLPITNYDWKIGKLAKDFYTTKFGDGTFSANKVKELLTTEHNFNKLLTFVIPSEMNEERMNTVEESLSKDEPSQERDSSIPLHSTRNDNYAIGYAICCETDEILHYSYPFYNIQSENNNLGMGMMLRTILYTREHNKKYMYLGSVTRPGDIYKLQFAGLEWFSEEKWCDDLDELKNVLKN